jgi:hydrogenase small subunit
MADRTAEQQAGIADAGLIREIDVLWINAGLSCDGDTIAMTAATQPSIEEVIFGALAWIPRVKLHNLLLVYENGDEFLKSLHLAAEGRLEPFILVVEGSIPNEDNKSDLRYQAGLGGGRSGKVE